MHFYYKDENVEGLNMVKRFHFVDSTQSTEVYPTILTSESITGGNLHFKCNYQGYCWRVRHRPRGEWGRGAVK